MRPLELVVEGFKSYREEQKFTFDGRSLFAIVGPIGAGKSTILDAIVFALYGKTPRLERDTKKLINTASDDARVRLVFEADNVTWDVTRVLRQRGQPPNVLKRFGEDAIEATGSTAVSDRIEELLGLDFKAFCSSVVLPQGEFDRFLGATAGERSKILKGIFRLERVDALRDMAKQNSARLAGQVSQMETELRTLPSDAETLSRLESDLAQEQARAKGIREAMSHAAKAEVELERAEETLGELNQKIAEKKGWLQEVPEVAQLELLAAREEEVRSASEAAEKSLAAASAGLAKADQKRAVAEKETGGEEVVRKARDHGRDLGRVTAELESLRAQEASLRRAVADAEKSVDRDQARAAAATALLTEAREALEALRRRHAAHLLRKELASGEPCPVCEQEVARLPAPGRVPTLESKEVAVKKAEAKAEAARAALEQAQRAQVLAKERLATWAVTAKKANDDLERLRKELIGLIGSVRDPAKEIERRESLLIHTRAALESARKQLGAAESAARAVLEKINDVAGTRNRFAANLNRICGALRIPPPDHEASTVALIHAAKRAADTAVMQIKMDEKKREETQAMTVSFERILRDFRKQFELGADEPITIAFEQVNASIGSIRSEIETVKRAIERAREIDSEIGRVGSERDLYERLGRDLTDTGFIEFLLQNQRRLLSRIGSEKLFELTGRYRFDEEGEFTIVDDRFGKSRTADTLSGGETFLASLALALALAEAVSQEGGRLECFFLDEGFGSLDTESLDLALEGIEALAAPGRLIGLISHVGGIQARLDDLIVLDKNEDGTTWVIQHEGAISYPALNV